MKTRILIGIMIVMMALPVSAHAWAVLRWAYDGLANQLGVSRGPIPKSVRKPPPLDPAPHGQANQKVPPVPPNIYIQAEGF